jgi:diamine N-acetyltransferase
MPDLRYGRLLLRAIERSDLPVFLRFLSDPEVVENLGAPVFPTNMEDEERWYESMLRKPLHEHPLAICIESPDTGTWKLIGNSAFHHIDPIARHAELGLLIGDKNEWNKGYGTEAMQAMQWLGFTELNLNRLYLKVFAENKGGIRAYEKAGFVHEGRLRQERFHKGVYGDSLIMSILKEEWEELQKEKKGQV